MKAGRYEGALAAELLGRLGSYSLSSSSRLARGNRTRPIVSRLKICAPSSGVNVIELSYDIYAFSKIVVLGIPLTVFVIGRSMRRPTPTRIRQASTPDVSIIDTKPAPRRMLGKLSIMRGRRRLHQCATNRSRRSAAPNDCTLFALVIGGPRRRQQRALRFSTEFGVQRTVL